MTTNRQDLTENTPLVDQQEKVNFFERTSKEYGGLPPEIFNHISSFLPLEEPSEAKKNDFRANPLSALSIASPDTKKKTDATDSGKILNERNQLTPSKSYLDAYLVTPYGYPTFVSNAAIGARWLARL